MNRLKLAALGAAFSVFALVLAPLHADRPTDGSAFVSRVLAAGYPSPNFSQLMAGSTASLAAFEVVRCTDNGDSTCNPNVNISGTVTTAPASSATGTLSNVAGSASSVTCLAANTARKGVIITNDSTAVLYIGLTASAVSTSSYTVQVPGSTASGVGSFQLPNPVNYTGQINCIWASATGNARITELT